jgi:hypothetical protein
VNRLNRKNGQFLISNCGDSARGVRLAPVFSTGPPAVSSVPASVVLLDVDVVEVAAATMLSTPPSPMSTIMLHRSLPPHVDVKSYIMMLCH